MQLWPPSGLQVGAPDTPYPQFVPVRVARRGWAGEEDTSGCVRATPVLVELVELVELPQAARPTARVIDATSTDTADRHFPTAL